ncbi:monooxygenase (plasmid) [Rhizobium grahamii]|uniref:Monooxygenase n=1 Tax=Rhizobium grahamii TaxID=1120045 RepID=A0A5Q0CET5_9HYPH|nr:MULTISPECIES: FAD-dependent monooxygenase [Rhizobium]QFY63815.1 monooxygenase [Rhizobium grahamii]QRM52942.1 monooxygenase [Rhizobium sp. BG6]
MPTSVLISGAGPVGLTLALELIRFGVPCRIIDKSPSRTDKSKALAVWSRTLELLDRSGAAPALIETGRKMHVVKIMSGKKTIARVNFDGLASPFPFVLMIPQSETERVLEEKLEALGGKVERNVEFVDFVDDGKTVTSTVVHPDGRKELIVTDWLAGCDGAHSPIRHQLGMPFEGDTVPGTFLLADVHVSGLDMAEDEFPIFWHRSGIVAFFPIATGRYRVIADMGAEPQRDLTLDDVQTIVDQRGPGGLVVSDCVWLAPFTINERKVKDFRAGRVFLAGDAAHIHSPAGGQGMNTGIQDAINLAWKLALVIEDRGDPELLLNSYSIERSANATQVLKDSGRMLRVGMMQNVAGQAVRDFLIGKLFGLSFVNHIAADRLSELAVAYDESPLNGPEMKGLGFPRPGHRMAGFGTFGSKGAHFSLVAADPAEAAVRLKDYMNLIDGDIRSPSDVDGMCLVRPDGYVAVTTHRDGWEDLTAFLGRVSGA